MDRRTALTASNRPSKLPREFYCRPTLTVARELLGKRLVRRIGNTTLAGIIVEVEAYLGSIDPASHSFRGKTRRNEVMFQEGGYLYVYFTYGMHFCCNVVTEGEGTGRAVLIRAVQPLEGIDLMYENRGFEAAGKIHRSLTNGPAKLCQALQIAREENGTDLLGNEIFITEGDSIKRAEIARSPRIGISQGKEKLWRFYLRANPWVSKPPSSRSVD